MWKNNISSLNARVLELANKNYPRRTQVPPFQIISLLPLHFFFLICFCRFCLCFSDCSAPLDLLSVFQIILCSPDLCFFSSNLRFLDRVLCSSSFFESGSLVLVLHLRSSDTSMELESEKLEFHMDKLLHLSTRTQISKVEFVTKLELHRLEMLVP